MTERPPFYNTLIGRVLILAALAVVVVSWFWDGDLISLAYVCAMIVIVVTGLSFRRAELARQPPAVRSRTRKRTVQTLLAMTLGLFAFAIVATALQELDAPTGVSAAGAILAGVSLALVVFRPRSAASASAGD